MNQKLENSKKIRIKNIESFSTFFLFFSSHFSSKTVFQLTYFTMTLKYAQVLFFVQFFITLSRENATNWKKNFFLRLWSEHSVLLAQ